MPLITVDWDVDPIVYPHIAALVTARDHLMAYGSAWAAQGPCGCICLHLGHDSTRREVEDWAVVLWRHHERDRLSDLPNPNDPEACLAWIEDRALDLGLLPCDPYDLPDPDHPHGPWRTPPRDRAGWLRTAEIAWPNLPEPLVVRRVGTQDREAIPDPFALACLFDDEWASAIPGDLPAVADVLINLVGDLGLVPDGLPHSVLAVLTAGVHPRGHRHHRAVVRHLRTLRRPRPEPVCLQPGETWVLRKWLREHIEVPGVLELRPRDFERGVGELGFTLDGLDPQQWVRLVRERCVKRTE